MEKTTCKIQDRFQIGLLWKENVKLVENFNMAEKRLVGIEKKMQRNPEFAEKYKGYAKKLTNEEIANRNQHVWYLPHFATLTNSTQARESPYCL